MGKLALYGALAGAAEGLGKQGETERAAEASAAAAKQASRAEEIEAQRELRLQNLKHRQNLERDRSASTLGHAQNVELETVKSGLKNEASTSARASDQEFKSKENLLERDHETRLQELKNKNSLELANKKSKTQTSRWKMNSTKRSTMGPDGMKEEPVTTLTDKETGATYEQKGSMFIPQGVDTTQYPKPPNLAKAAKWLIANPQNSDAFIEAYGYLPAAYFREMDLLTTHTSESDK